MPTFAFIKIVCVRHRSKVRVLMVIATRNAHLGVWVPTKQRGPLCRPHTRCYREQNNYTDELHRSSVPRGGARNLSGRACGWWGASAATRVVQGGRRCPCAALSRLLIRICSPSQTVSCQCIIGRLLFIE